MLLLMLLAVALVRATFPLLDSIFDDVLSMWDPGNEQVALPPSTPFKRKHHDLVAPPYYLPMSSIISGLRRQQQQPAVPMPMQPYWPGWSAMLPAVTPGKSTMYTGQ